MTLSFQDSHPQLFLMILSIIEAYAAKTVSSMIATRMNRCERQVAFSVGFDDVDTVGDPLYE